jgi:LemA protein
MMVFLSGIEIFIQIAITLLLILVLCFLIFGGMGIVTIYNRFQEYYQFIQEGLSNIGVLTQKRYDLLLSLAQTVKKYNDHEFKTLKETIAGRQFNTNAPASEQVKQISSLQDSLVKLQALIEAYPQIKADSLHMDIMGRNAELEQQILSGRVSYNNNVCKYNIICRKFPSNIVAKLFRYHPLNYLDHQSQPPFEPRKVYAEF